MADTNDIRKGVLCCFRCGGELHQITKYITTDTSRVLAEISSEGIFSEDSDLKDTDNEEVSSVLYCPQCLISLELTPVEYIQKFGPTVVKEKEDGGLV
jgi:hypothetical protein